MSNGTIYYYGMYRAIVENTVDDPLGERRVGVNVVSIPGQEEILTWATPCVPSAGPGRGFYIPPEVGDHVWVEFEGGDLSKPVWLGSFWDPPSGFPDVGVPPTVTFLATTAATVSINDTLGTVRIETAGGGVVSIDDTAGKVLIENGHGAVIELEEKTITFQGWPMKFKPAPPGTGDLASRVTALEAAVQALGEGQV
jgi:hypothetical protein